MKQIGIDQVKQLDSQLENLNSAIDANDNSIIELNTAVEETNNSIIELNNVLEGKQDTLIAGTGITIENNVISLNGGSSKSALQVTCSYNDDVLKGVAVVVDDTTINTKSNGLATFTGLDSGTKTITASKDGFATNTSSKTVANPFEFSDIEMNPITLTFTVKDVENNAIVGAIITLGNYTVTTDNNGQATISGILDGVYTYIISKATFSTITGLISINRQNVNQPVIMTSALIVGKSSGSFSVGDTVKLNAGVGENNYDFTAYPSDTMQTNDLTIDGEVAEVKTDSIVLTEEPQIENAEITIEVDQDNADIQFNNGNDICTVNIVANMSETHNYLAFKRQSDNSIIYFKDRTYPFVPSDNNYPETSFTYYTYENNVMVSHTATTQSSSVGDSTYDGATLIIYSVTVAVNGTWLRDTEQDKTITVENDGATITTSSYLTTPEAVIPTTNNSKFAMEKSNDWNILMVVGGALTNLANLQEILVPNNTIIDTYVTLNDGQPAKLMKNTYFKRYTITNDYTLRKQKVVLNVNVPAKVTFTINGISKIIENTQLAQFDVYAGETVYYTIEVDGYVSQTGNYTVPQIVTQKEYQQSITLQGLTVGSRLMNIASFVTYFTPSGEYDVDSLKFLKLATNDIDNITTLRINKTLWLSQVETTLGILTPKGSSNTFTFTYNGTTWDLSGTTTISAISTSDLGTLYGITFIGTPETNDNIVVTETQYNKFAVYVLDSNYRGNYSMGGYNEQVMPISYTSTSTILNCTESATYFYDYVANNKVISNYPMFNVCKNLGNFILPNGIKINAVIPIGYELLAIWNNRVFLDSCDPVIQSGGTNYNLTNWAFTKGKCSICQERDNSYFNTLNNGGYFADALNDLLPKYDNGGFCPVFEVPIM